MRIALVGCGYVADLYMVMLRHHPELRLLGVMDRDAERARIFAEVHGLEIYPTLDAVLGDERVEIVVNLTNPRSHYAVTRAALLAGKHVYTEKPIAMDFGQARELVELAEEHSLSLASAPCSVLGESAQTLWKAIREGAVGPVKLVYAELDDGMVHRRGYRDWVSRSGAPWPANDEFEIGCTMEHAGYYLTWLTAFFGPVRSVTSFAAALFPDKGTDVPLDVVTPDFSVGCLEFHSGVVARLTCSIVAPDDRSLRVVGEDGVLTVEDCWDYRSPVHSRPTPLGRRAEHHPVASRLMGLRPRRYPQAESGVPPGPSGLMDFFRGVAELAASIREGRPCRLPARHALHVNELALAMQYPGVLGSPRVLESTFDPIEPMPWAREARAS